MHLEKMRVTAPLVQVIPLVPSNSSEMATRILQQLEKLVPKEKLSEGKVVTGRDKSPSKLTRSMLRGQALRSLENVDSSKILQNALDSYKLEELRDTSQLDACETTSQKQDEVEENGPKMSIVSREAEAPAVTRGAMVSVKDNVAGVHTADSVVTAPLTQPTQKKWAFHMSAHEVGGVSSFGLCSLKFIFLVTRKQSHC